MEARYPATIHSVLRGGPPSTLQAKPSVNDIEKTEKYQLWQIENTLHGGMIRELERKEFPKMDHWALEGN
jgi:hypothetical protein